MVIDSVSSGIDIPKIYIFRNGKYYNGDIYIYLYIYLYSPICNTSDFCHTSLFQFFTYICSISKAIFTHGFFSEIE